MNTTRLSLLTIAAALALAGCGNKGPLVLPDAPEEEAPVVVDETDTAANPAAGGAEAATDEDTTDGGAIDDPDAPVEPEPRSEEHTSELQSLMRNSYAVFCLKKKKQTKSAQQNQ